MKINSPLLNSAPGIITLMYHRIDEVDTNPWGVCISPENFEKQICFLKKNLNVIAIDDLITSIGSGKFPKKTVCITFDDGYADNYIHAKPILEKYHCAATFFIATSFINQNNSFWWDELEMIFLHSNKLPDRLTLQIGNKTTSYLLKETELTKQQWLQQKKWKWHESTPTDRCTIFLSIWKQLTALSPENIAAVINELKHWSHCNDQEYPRRLPMNAEQLHKLFTNKLFTPGVHTHTHCDLSQQKKQIQFKEIETCQNILKNKYNVARHYLSYPFGRYNADTIENIKELQFSACFTTEPLPLSRDSNKFLLGRYQPFNWNKSTFQQHLARWFCHSY